MVVKVLISRTIKEGRSQEVFKLLNELRALAVSQPGYFSGETLISQKDPHKLAVISTWLNLESWRKWKNNKKRKTVNSKIEKLLNSPTQYELFYCGSYPS